MGQTIAENLVDPETGEILVEAGTEMTRDVIDSIAEYLDGDLNKFVYTPNDYAVVTEPVVLQNSRLLHQMIQTVWLQLLVMPTQMTKFVL